MAHSIRFEQFDDFLLSKDEVRDFIDMFYRWGDAKFIVRTDKNERKVRGRHCVDLGGVHTVSLVKQNIARDFQRGTTIGGNLRAPSLKCAAGMVLAHELQHANQSKLHKQEEGFYRDHRYWNRACERDARQFVDEHIAEICAYFDVSAPVRRKGPAPTGGDSEALAVAGLLSECSEVSMEDIRDELRASGILTPSSVRLVVEHLRGQEIDIK